MLLPDVADAQLTEGRGQVRAQQQFVELRCLRRQLVLIQPVGRVLPEGHSTR